MVLYADMLVAVNALTDYFLLRCCAALCRQPVRRVRIVIAALVGGLASLLILAPTAWIPAAGAAAAAAAMCAVAFGVRSLRAWLVQVACLYGIGMGWSGIWYALWITARPDGMYWHGGMIYFSVSPPVFVAVTVAGYAVQCLVRRIVRTRRKPHVVRFRLRGNGHTVCGVGLVDSGNLLTEPISGLPVIVADRAFAAPVFVPLHGVTDDCAAPESAQLARQHFRLVRFDTLRGGGLLPACRPEFIASDDEPLRPAAELYVASCAGLRADTGYDAIFPASAFDHYTERIDTHAPTMEQADPNHSQRIPKEKYAAVHQRIRSAAQPTDRRAGSGCHAPDPSRR